MARTAKAPAAAGYRKPTYGSAGRLARLVLELGTRPAGWSFEAAQEELRVSERTLLRYLKVCREELVTPDGRPLVEVTRRGERRFLRLADPDQPGEASVYQSVFLYFTLAALTAFEGTVLKETLETVRERLERTVAPRQRHRMANLSRKFHAVPYAGKDYRQVDEQLDCLVRCLIDQHRMRVDYRGVEGEGKVHEFDPYTLVTYREGLYVIGFSHLYRRIIWLAVERIRGAEKLPERFDYPKGYSPDRHTEGVFGIIEGPEVEVEILLRTPRTAALVESRRIHPTQRFERLADGTTRLTMRVRGTTELTSWILSLSPYVEVRKPADLRKEIADRLAESAALYAAPPRGAVKRRNAAGRAAASPAGRDPRR
jgi:predicted DNA-binding transcriptional regulator YafY